MALRPVHSIVSLVRDPAGTGDRTAALLTPKPCGPGVRSAHHIEIVVSSRKVPRLRIRILTISRFHYYPRFGRQLKPAWAYPAEHRRSIRDAASTTAAVQSPDNSSPPLFPPPRTPISTKHQMSPVQPSRSWLQTNNSLTQTSSLPLQLLPNSLALIRVNPP